MHNTHFRTQTLCRTEAGPLMQDLGQLGNRIQCLFNICLCVCEQFEFQQEVRHTLKHSLNFNRWVIAPLAWKEVVFVHHLWEWQTRCLMCALVYDYCYLWMTFFVCFSSPVFYCGLKAKGTGTLPPFYAKKGKNIEKCNVQNIMWKSKQKMLLLWVCNVIEYKIYRKS